MLEDLEIIKSCPQAHIELEWPSMIGSDALCHTMVLRREFQFSPKAAFIAPESALKPTLASELLAM